MSLPIMIDEEKMNTCIFTLNLNIPCNGLEANKIYENKVIDCLGTKRKDGQNDQ